MQKLIDTPYLLSQFDISEDVIASRLEKNIGAASRRLRTWVTDAVYQSVLAIPEPSDGSPEPELYYRKEDFKLAEANLAMHFATLGLNTPITSKGIIKSSKAKDFAVITYYTPDEIIQARQLYLDQAEEILRPYLANIDSVTIDLVNVYSELYTNGGC